MATVPVYCLCGQPYDVTRFMIQCDACKEWFHGSCVGLREHQSNDIEKYHCPKCMKMFGPSVFKQRTNWHRHDYTELDADNKAVQTGTPVFIKELKSRHFPSAEEFVTKLRGQQLNLPYLIQHGFNAPLLVERKDGLGLTVPSESFTIEDVEAFIGSEREVDVIDVGRQEDIRMTMREFVEYYVSPNRTKVLNLISLEFSNSKLSELVEAPYIVRKLSWVNTVWPDPVSADASLSKPEVQKYCLLGVKDSFTDFHIDFGGTSVWYHVLKGEKIFYLIKPISANLALYEQWMSSSNQTETFFGDQVDACFKCVVKQGQTLFIPTGWIHAVFTPIDSLVFGGNFLNSFNIPLQLQIYELERRIKTPEKFRFPSFEAITWYAAKHLLEQLKDFNDEDSKPAQYILQGIKALINTLRMWTQEKDFAKIHKPEIPDSIQYTKLIKDLNKEFRQAEKPPNNKAKEDQKKKKVKTLKDLADECPESLDLNKNGENKDHLTPLRLNLGKTGPLSEEGLVNSIAAAAIINDHSTLVSAVSQSSFQQLSSPEKIKSPIKPQAVSPFKLWISKTSSPSQESSDADSPLKMKLAKNAARNKKNNVGAANAKTAAAKRNISASAKKEGSLVKKDDSVYDFKDSDDDNLVVDENPPAHRRFNASKIKQETDLPGPLKLKLSFNGKSTVEQSDAIPATPQALDSSEVDVTSFPKNSGIEELLRASGYATDTESKLEEELGNGRASPSTREAIQGMLSIGCAVQFSTLTTSVNTNNSSSGGGSGNAGQSRSQRQRKFILSDDVGENMSKCHQDDEYVYPTLDVSDDEVHVFKPRGRVKRDEPWNPKARLVPNCPKPDRPVREGVKKESVESGLAAAAAKLANLPPPKRPYHRKKPVQPKTTPVKEEVEAVPSTSSGLAVKRPSTAIDLASKGKKPKKGMATAKQRLGKILKIHKMLY